MNTKTPEILQKIAQDAKGRYRSLNLKFNPFPIAGSAYIQANDDFVSYLEPTEEKTKQKVADFIATSLSTQGQDKYQGMTIIGEYGTGKTQLLMYIKFLLEYIASHPEKYNQQKPYVIYIDNPGVKIAELIASIIAEVGQANFNKYLWNFIIEKIEENSESFIKSFPIINKSLLENDNPFDKKNKISYKLFLNSFYNLMPKKNNKRNFDDIWKEKIFEILKHKDINPKEDVFIANTYFNLISDELGLNLAWDKLLNENNKNIEKREVHFLNSLISLLERAEKYTVYLLVDEFEDITRGRLSKTQMDNYLHNLRTLIDKERRWSVVFAMTGEAYSKIEITVPPLAERMTTTRIELSNELNIEDVKKLIRNYISFAKSENNNNTLFPFSEESLETILEVEDINQNPRRFLSFCFKIIEKAKDLDKEDLPIKSDFIQNL